MRTEYWQQRWREGRTGWHHAEVSASLTHYWPGLGVPPSTRVFVPLCGKSPAMAWFAAQGLQVLGVEVSDLAIEQFYAEHRLTPVRRADHPERYTAGGIEIVRTSVFDLDHALLAGCGAFYDRAAIIAQPAEDRRRYAAQVYAHLPQGCTGLMVTLDYPQPEMEGPPFSVDPQELRALFADAWDIETLERKDVLTEQPGFREQGLTALHAGVYRLRRR
ncbi:MAG TPA: thiopurine S-methyltransferase [Nevskiaceae bacterium]